MNNEPEEDRGWSPGHRNQDIVLAWTLGIVIVGFVALTVLLF